MYIYLLIVAVLREAVGALVDLHTLMLIGLRSPLLIGLPHVFLKPRIVVFHIKRFSECLLFVLEDARHKELVGVRALRLPF